PTPEVLNHQSVEVVECLQLPCTRTRYMGQNTSHRWSCGIRDVENHAVLETVTAPYKGAVPCDGQTRVHPSGNAQQRINQRVTTHKLHVVHQSGSRNILYSGPSHGKTLGERDEHSKGEGH